ncbi:DNA polymerase subunit gamma-2, mitochondrial isoform X1 [Lepeophtheirus salmonis]|uniref:Anticodon-binding domain-containing protein n=1 Tax=Lepeophtheirus salmonis TaxID=72036 RepID=A0A0K2UGG0_LEPSM|nr:DNA polymerase subunit gamma-2, mitochondrial-like [Lepeophtheirus salmonis]
MIKTLSKHLSPFTNRHFSSIHKDPIDDTKSNLQFSLEYLVKGRYLRPNPIPYIRFAKNGTLLRHQFLRKYKDLVQSNDVLLSAQNKVSFSKFKEGMDGATKRSLFVWPTEGPFDVCSIIKGEGFDNDNYILKPLASQNEEFKIKSYVFMNKDISWRFALQDVLRERRIWWKRLFFNPGAIFIPEEVESNSEFPVARISTNFEDQDYGFNDNFVVESLKMLDDFEGYKVLETSTCPSIGTLALLLDAVRERMFLSNRPRMALNQYIVPHQLAIFMSDDYINSSPQIRNFLSEFRVFLSKALRKEGLRLYSTPQESLDIVDLIGIPFVIILSPKTLDDGICNIWDRETYWYEEVHVADVVSRFVQIFQKRWIPSLG